MAGHYKWSKVERHQDALDADTKRGELITKLAKENTLVSGYRTVSRLLSRDHGGRGFSTLHFFIPPLLSATGA